MGYGRIADQPSDVTFEAPVKGTLYTALGCPFCPLMEQRLEQLRKQLGFELRKVDVTLRPDLLAGKGIRSVPVVEVGGQLLTGLVTSKELAAAIAQACMASIAG
jgi:predicted DsbA family dithiol-disulfide isomerase